MKLLRHIVAIALVAFACPIAATDDSADTADADPRVTMYLPRVTATADKPVDTVSVTIQTRSTEVAGFDLKIGCDSRLVSIIEILPGEIPDSCDWEYFNSRDLYDPMDPQRPSSLWKIVALAKATPGPEPPACYGLDRRAGIVDLVLSYEPDAFATDTSVSLFFYWEDCRDNVISDKSATTALVSDKVYSYVGEALDAGDGFPSRTGTPRQCVDMTKRNHARRIIDFHNGGVAFSLIGEGLFDSSGVTSTAADSTLDTLK